MRRAEVVVVAAAGLLAICVGLAIQFGGWGLIGFGAVITAAAITVNHREE